MRENSITIKRDKVDYLFKWSGTVALLFVLLLFTLLYRLSKDAALPASSSLLVLSVFLLLGIGLPRWIGFKIRQDRATESKRKEYRKWGFHGRDREGPWINYVDHPVVKRAECARGMNFYSEWLIIQDGLIVVNPGESKVVLHENGVRTVTYDLSVRRTYAWDGCTPKRFFYWVAVIGTPDWWHATQKVETIEVKNGICRIAPKDPEPIWQIAHHASLIHDALYQYLDHHPIAKKDVDRLFRDMLIASGVPGPVASIYYWFVKNFGPAHEEGIEPVEAVYALEKKLCFEKP